MVLVIVNAASVLFMAGVGWLVQLVAYPLFAEVDTKSFPSFHAEWSRRITWVVIVPMGVDLITSLWLSASPPSAIDLSLAVSGAVLAAVTWASTALLQVPRHGELSSGFDATAHARLVSSSWLRTAAWSTHAVICCVMIAQLAG
jgi:hypothetical protein